MGPNDRVQGLAATVDALAAHLPATVPPDRRFVLALAGPPAAGKSTLAAALVEALAPRAVLVGLDAWHFDDAILAERGHGEHKGAPHTFDVDGYGALLKRLRRGRDAMTVPIFDRSLELARNAAALVDPQHEIVVTEGNWLLLETGPWTSLRPLFDLTVYVDAPSEVIADRIVERWLSHGFSIEDATMRAERNDLPNARLAKAGSQPADLTLATA